MLTILLVIALVSAGCSVILLLHRKLRQAKIAAGLKLSNARGIVTEEFVAISGTAQWISIRGEDLRNPVMLIIHGGPGCSYAIFSPHLRSWEQHFTVVQWDQPGCGKTLRRSGMSAAGPITMERLTRDGIELAEYLCSRLRKNRIFLLASSFGSTFGLEMARRQPDLFHAYIGTDQNVGMVRGRNESHRHVIDALRRLGLDRGVNFLERLGPDPTRWGADEYTAAARWTMKTDPVGFRRTIKLLKDAVWFAPGWDLMDIRTFVKGMQVSCAQLLAEAVRFDAWQSGTRFELPFLVLQGEDDVVTPAPLAAEYFNDVSAPAKHMALIRDAGHFAIILQPEQALDHLLQHAYPLASEGEMVESRKVSSRFN